MYVFHLSISVLFVYLFTACAQSPQIAESETTSEKKPAEVMPETRLPDSVLGTFDQTKEACSSDTFTKLTVTQEKLQFYYGYADIEAVSLRNKRYGIDATFFQLEGVIEVRPEAATYRIEPSDRDDSIRFENIPTGQPPSLLIRCDES